MKVLLITIALIINAGAMAQNIGIGTETPQGKLHIKGSAEVSQLVIDASATQTVDHPVILLRTSAGDELMRIHADNIRNLFIGYQAGLVNPVTTSSTANTFIGNGVGPLNYSGYNNTAMGAAAFARNTIGANNVAVGSQSLFHNTQGYSNTAIGTNAMNINTTGSQNTALGFNALYVNGTGSNNTALGWSALSRSTTGQSNTSVGTSAMDNNTAGSNNTAMGVNALINNSGADASNNTAIGLATLYNTTNSQYNTALGYYAGSQRNNGYNNVFLGANTDVNGAGYYNVIAIGQGTICTASSQVTIGNGATNSYRAYANWSNISDGRFKKNIQENVPGLAFVMQLRPVTYNLNATGLDDFLHPINDPAAGILRTNDVDRSNITPSAASGAARAVYLKALKEKESEVITGFVAQDVEATAKQLGFTFSGVEAPKAAGDVYALRYAEFVVPLVRAVQEQQALIKDLQKQIDALKALLKK